MRVKNDNNNLKDALYYFSSTYLNHQNHSYCALEPLLSEIRITWMQVLQYNDGWSDDQDHYWVAKGRVAYPAWKFWARKIHTQGRNHGWRKTIVKSIRQIIEDQSLLSYWIKKCHFFHFSLTSLISPLNVYYPKAYQYASISPTLYICLYMYIYINIYIS